MEIHSVVCWMKSKCIEYRIFVTGKNKTMSLRWPSTLGPLATATLIIPIFVKAPPPPKNRKHVLFTFCDLYQNFEKWCHYRNTETRTSKQFSVFLKTCVVLFLTRNQMHHVTCDFLFLSVSRRSSDFTVVCAYKFAVCYLSDNTFLSFPLGGGLWRIIV